MSVFVSRIHTTTRGVLELLGVYKGYIRGARMEGQKKQERMTFLCLVLVIWVYLQ